MITIKAVLFDFGGVLAEEGFRNGLAAIARQEGLDPASFFQKAESIIYSTGYVLGHCPESEFWQALRKETGIKMPDEELHGEILGRFVLRPEMFQIVNRLREQGLWIGILSDQTNWLEELDRKYGFYRAFDRVFNSYRLHKSKKDPAWFREICSELGLVPQEALFIDDNFGHITRAANVGLKTIYYQNQVQFRMALGEYFKDGCEV
ncbi:MAG TPA: HAD family phosphatase [Thermodesulfobacteriota bacterium]|nr:HAD family phosphatase [Thermodesulfobacteriota bacterium]